MWHELECEGRSESKSTDVLHRALTQIRSGAFAGSGKPYVMGTKCPHKDGNIQNPCPCGDIFGPHEETSL